jgi:hypothetical protein
MPELKPIQIAGWLKDVNDDFDTLEPLMSGDLAAGGLGVLRVGAFTFDSAGQDSAGEDNLGVGAHGVGVELPDFAIIVGGFVDVNTAFDSVAHTATIAIHVVSANDIITAAAVSGEPWSTIGRKAIKPKANTPESTSVKTEEVSEITVTVGVQALSVGKLTGYLYYVEGVLSASGEV